MTQKRSFLSTAILFLCCWYLFLCAVHYTHQRPLWLDEQSVLKNITTFQGGELFTKPLLIGQVFPRFYLFLIQKFSQPFDFHVLALRLFSFISMITAFFIWLRIARRELQNQGQFAIFVLGWAGSSLLVYYSAELKPYSADVLASSLFLWFISGQKEWARKNERACLAALILLPLLGLFSYTVFLFFVFPFYNLLMEKNKRAWHWIALGGYSLSALAVAAFVYVFDIKVTNAPTTIGMMWKDYFISYESWGEFLKTWGEGTKNLFCRWFAERPRVIKQIAVFFMAFGLIRMFTGFLGNIKKNKDYLHSIDVIGLLAYLELFILASLQKYPFSVPRTALFFCPIVLLMTVKGIADLKSINKYLYRTVNFFYIIFLAVVAIGISRVVLTQDFSFASQIW